MTQDFEISSYGKHKIKIRVHLLKRSSQPQVSISNFQKTSDKWKRSCLQMEFFCKISCLHFLLKSTEKKYNSCLRYLRNITWSPLSRQLGKYIYHGDRNTWPLANNQLITNSFSQGKRLRRAEEDKDRPHIGWRKPGETHLKENSFPIPWSFKWDWEGDYTGMDNASHLGWGRRLRKPVFSKKKKKFKFTDLNYLPNSGYLWLVTETD